MKKLMAILIAILLVAFTVACNNGSGSNEGAGTNTNSGNSTTTNATYKTGLGITAAMSMTEPEKDTNGNSKASVTTCAATFDSNGKIVSVVFDTIECKTTVSNTGNITLPDTFKSKKALGDSYNMKGASSIGKEWYEQVNALEKYCIGKTVSEVTGMTVKTVGDHKDVPDVPDLTSSCTISCTDFFKALDYAYTNAK